MTPTPTSSTPARVTRWAVWLPGLAVALGAAVATAHGLYEVAAAAKVPASIAWLYPLITDGLALVAYTATARLHGSAARYAWAVVVLAAGLSGLAQAVFLASDPTAATVLPGNVAEPAGAGFAAPPALRFGIGAWPAIAAAIVAHLLYLLATDDSATRSPAFVSPHAVNSVHAEPANPQPVQSVMSSPVQPATSGGVQRPAAGDTAPSRPQPGHAPAEQPTGRPGTSPARDRARTAATRHLDRHHTLPTVTELEAVAQVSRGTAAAVLKALREQPTPLHLITSTQRQDHDDDPTIEERTQP